MTPRPPAVYFTLVDAITAAPASWSHRVLLLCKLDRHLERDDPKRFEKYAERAARLMARKGN
jgi:hypothetical protein